VVKASGKIFEFAAAVIGRRRRCNLYHSALIVRDSDGPIVIEMTPVVDANGAQRGVVGEGAVGVRWLGRFRLFRYEIRRWTSGVIPDQQYAHATLSATSESASARQLLDLVPFVPTPVWGRDELRTGDMWNSNSVTSWLLTRSGVDLDQLKPPFGGRAPGWDAGVVVATRAAAGHARV